jgi:hypothetical protein
MARAKAEQAAGKVRRDSQGRTLKAIGRPRTKCSEVVSKRATDSVPRQTAKLSPVLSSFYRGELAELRRRSICPDLVFGRLWGEIGCRGVLRRHLADRCYGFDAERAIYLTVTHRDLWYPAPIAMPAPRSTAYI